MLGLLQDKFYSVTNVVISLHNSLYNLGCLDYLLGNAYRVLQLGFSLKYKYKTWLKCLA